MRAVAIVVMALMSIVAVGRAQEPIRYLVRVEDPGSHYYHVEAVVPATGDTTFVSLPAWTPGHYTLENYARLVYDFEATDANGGELGWDKNDKDTWRIVSNGASSIRVAFDFYADTLNLSGSLLRDGFGFFNGTNLFVFPETGYDFPAELRFELPDGWRVATELEEGEAPFTYTAADYHELVDNPTFLGRFAMDSSRVDGRWIRLVVYPGEYLADPARSMAMNALEKIASYLHELFGDVPYDRYTTLVYLATEPLLFFGGLEHAESHFDLLPAVAFERPRFTFRAFIYRLLSHEYYHAWNVKRIRPAELWPYDYDREQYTPLLWVSEGITDYYAHLVLVRAGLWNADEFWGAIRTSIEEVGAQPHVAVEDASLSTWIEPRAISQNYYYDKGALLGLMLDIRIRHATGNEHSLDDVMNRLYRERFQKDRGFTTRDFLGYVAEHLGEEETRAFYRDYVDGRRSLPYSETLRLAGMRYEADTLQEPFFGVSVAPTGQGRMVVQSVQEGSSADRAGLEAGDLLEQVGQIALENQSWGADFRDIYADSVGATVTVRYRRRGEQRESRATVRVRTRYEHRLTPADDASEAELELRRAVLARPEER